MKQRMRSTPFCNRRMAGNARMRLMAGPWRCSRRATAHDVNAIPDANELSPKQRNDIGVQMLSRRAWDAYNADRFVEALNWLDRRAGYAAETRDLMQLRVWCLQKLQRTQQAGAIQSQLDQQLSR